MDNGNNYSIEEQVVFAKYMTTQLSQAGIPFAVNADTKYYDRQMNKWITERIPVFNTIFQSSLIPPRIINKLDQQFSIHSMNE